MRYNSHLCFLKLHFFFNSNIKTYFIAFVKVYNTKPDSTGIFITGEESFVNMLYNINYKCIYNAPGLQAS